LIVPNETTLRGNLSNALRSLQTAMLVACDSDLINEIADATAIVRLAMVRVEQAAEDKRPTVAWRPLTGDPDREWPVGGTTVTDCKSGSSLTVGNGD
jgi:hypothetical protein